jgi:hypothetical protein
VAFGSRQPDLLEPVRDILFRGPEADIGFTGGLAGPGIALPRLRREQEDAGQEIGEMRAHALCQRPAALPLRDLASGVERNQHDLLGFERFGRIGEGGIG